MYSEYVNHNEAVVVADGDQARIVVGMPIRVISANDLTEVDMMAINNFDGVTIKSETYMPRFEAAFVNRLLKVTDPVQPHELHDDVTAHFGGANEASTAALEYLDRMEIARTPNQLIREQTIESLINCYTDFEGWAVKQDDGSIALTKGGRAIAEAKFGTDPIVEIS